MLNGYSIRKCAEIVEINIVTKYLSNYMKWHKWMGTFSSEKETIRTKNLLVHSNIPHKYTKVKEFKTIIPNFI